MHTSDHFQQQVEVCHDRNHDENLDCWSQLLKFCIKAPRGGARPWYTVLFVYCEEKWRERGGDATRADADADATRRGRGNTKAEPPPQGWGTNRVGSLRNV